MATKVFYLKDEDLATDHDPTVFVLTSSLPDHKLAYRLNNLWGASFARTARDHETLVRKESFRYTVYAWRDPITDCWWQLVSNRGNSGEVSTENSSPLFREPVQRLLLPKEKRVDYILMTLEDNTEAILMLEQLKRLPGVENARPWTPGTPAEREAIRIESETHTI